jgi:hypothetical protein
MIRVRPTRIKALDRIGDKQMSGGEVFLSDNSGNRVCHPHTVDPVAASGITLATGTAGDDKTQTLVGGQLYAITPIGTTILASITGVTSTAANIEFCFPPNVTSLFRMPIDKTTLYYEGDTSSKNAYARKVA